MRKAERAPLPGGGWCRAGNGGEGVEMAMMDVGETIAWVVRHTLRTSLRGMALAVTAVAWLDRKSVV